MRLVELARVIEAQRNLVGIGNVRGDPSVKVALFLYWITTAIPAS